MRRLLWIALLATSLMAAEEGHGGGHAEPSILWKWANFLLLGGALGFLISKHAPAFFKDRTDQIQSGLNEARKLRAESEARVTEIEKRVASLETDLKQLRENARKEMASEGDRIRQETARAIAKIQAHAEMEIASAAKLARQELKSYSADLAVQLATRQIRDRLTPNTQDQLVDNFVKQLQTQKVAQ